MSIRIKRLFESKQDDLIAYINDCFVDLTDSGASFERDNEMYFLVTSLSHGKAGEKYDGWEDNNIVDFISTANQLKEIATQYDECIDKVKLKYPNIKYTIELDNNPKHGMRMMSTSICFEVE